MEIHLIVTLYPLFLHFLSSLSVFLHIFFFSVLVLLRWAKFSRVLLSILTIWSSVPCELVRDLLIYYLQTPSSNITSQAILNNITNKCHLRQCSIHERKYILYHILVQTPLQESVPKHCKMILQSIIICFSVVYTKDNTYW